MVQLIVGKKGKGKTKIILDMVNKEVSNVSGNIVYQRIRRHERQIQSGRRNRHYQKLRRT